ncbi:MAG: Spy/CpxP family protein refolding chaperone [Stellaceae bacterium]
MLLAGVIAATAALATPVFAQPTETPTNPPAEAAPSGAPSVVGGVPAASQPTAPERVGAPAGWMRHRGGWGMAGQPMMRQMMMRRMWMRGGDPQQRCIDRLAWRAARAAYIEAKLGLTAQQQPLWDKVESISRADQTKERQLCAQLKPGAEPTVLERLDRAQQFLSARLDALQRAKPAVEALYQALTPEQQAIMNHPFRP